MNSIISPIIESIKPKRGIGLVVILSLTLITAWLAFFVILNRATTPKLTDVSKAKLIGKLHFGGSATWGTILGCFGIALMSVYFSIDAPQGSDRAMFWVVVVPLLLTALLLFVYHTSCKVLPTKIDIVLKNAWLNKKVTAAKIRTNGHIDVTKIDVANLMTEFERYKILEFHIDNNGDYIIDSFHHIVEHYFREHPIQSDSAKSGSWVCKGCGATNNTLECEYCGNTKPE